jgi:hypothetical protein
MDLDVNEFKELLSIANIAIPSKSKKDDLWRLCLENQLVEREFYEKENITVVKCGLEKALNMDDLQKVEFIGRVNKYVSVVSRLLRRSSLILHYHLLRVFNNDKPIPDLYKANDTYWKQWLMIGMKDSPFPDKESNLSYQLVAPRFTDNELFNDVSNLKYFDQIKNYAAGTLRTCVHNNMWFPLFNKLERLVKYKLKEWFEETGISKYTIMNYIRSKESVPLVININALEFILEVRRLLHIENLKKKQTYVYDKHAIDNMTFIEAMKLNVWIQAQFSTMEKRCNILFPVFNVKRTFVRLDKKTLKSILQDMFPNHKEVLNNKKAISDFNKKIEGTSQAPHKLMLKEHVQPTLKKKINCTRDEWVSYKKALEEYNNKIELTKASTLFKEQEKAYTLKDNTNVDMIKSFFKPIRKNSKWAFDASIQTDGISVCIQFSHKIRLERKPTPIAQEIQHVEEYDHKLSTFISETDTIVLGLDPGRTNLAAISYYILHPDGREEKQHWSLSRKQYYAESGISKRAREKASRFKVFKESWSDLGSLRALQESHILDYVDKYNVIKEDWWNKALKEIESVNVLRTYSGKQRVLDRFFSKVKSDVKKFHPTSNIKLAYGSAAMNMSPTGKGEMSAPISATFKSCKRIFDTVVENEYGTSKNEWTTGKEVRAVYKRLKKGDKRQVLESFGNCHVKGRSPIVHDEEESILVRNYYARTRNIKPKANVHYPEIRGLRFLPEIRKYVDRDQMSSLAIARLAVMRMTTQTRPQVFSRKILGL